MAAPLSPQQLLDALRAEGVPIMEYPGWRDRCRCHSGSHEAGGPMVRSWGPNIGTTVHITAGDLGSRPVAKYILDIILSDPNVPTKCHFVVAPDGVCWIVASGRANHQGFLSQNAHDAYVNGAWRTDVPYDDRRGSGLTGNTYCYGIENIAASSMNAAQRRTSVLICAAISRAHGWSGNDCAGHGEGSSDRSSADPNLDMGAFRRDVMAQVAHQSTPPPPQPTPPPQKEWFDMATTPMLFVRRLNSPDGAIWLSDLIERRWIRDMADLHSTMKNLTDAGYKNLIVYDVENLAYFGVPIGPNPPSGPEGLDPVK